MRRAFHPRREWTEGIEGMKLTDAQVIKNAEQELIDGIVADLDWAVIEGHFKDRHCLEMGDEVAFKRGDLVVQGDQVNYQLDFEVKVRLRLLMDRDGNCLSVHSGGVPFPSPGQESESVERPPVNAEGFSAEGSGEAAEDRIEEAAIRVGAAAPELGTA